MGLHCAISEPLGAGSTLSTLHLGEFALSQRYGESAMRLYEEAEAHFGALHLHAHLGQIRLARGDLDGAAREYELMAARARDLPHDHGELVAIAQALGAEVAYETNDVVGSEASLEGALRSVEGSDAWLDVLAATAGAAARLAYLRSSLPGALSALAHAERTALQKNMPRLLRLVRIERIRALTLSDELDQAGEEIRNAGLAHHVDGLGGMDEADWAMRQGSTAVTLARFLIRSRRAAPALGVIDPAEQRALRGGQMLAVAKLRVLRATAHWQLRQRPEAIEALCEAIRLLGKQAFRRFILDEGAPVADSPRHTSAPTRSDRSPPRADDARSEQYVQLLALGLSNKEIARTLGVSPNTVKYHLKHIFKELHVDSRSRAVFRARGLGILKH